MSIQSDWLRARSAHIGNCVYCGKPILNDEDHLENGEGDMACIPIDREQALADGFSATVVNDQDEADAADFPGERRLTALNDYDGTSHRQFVAHEEQDATTMATAYDNTGPDEDGGEGPYAHATSGENDELPAAPTLLSATASSDTEIALAWTDNADNESAYIVERSLDEEVWEVVTDEVAADEESYNDTGLEASTEYFYRVRAINGTGGYSTYSNTDSATTEA